MGFLVIIIIAVIWIVIANSGNSSSSSSSSQTSAHSKPPPRPNPAPAPKQRSTTVPSVQRGQVTSVGGDFQIRVRLIRDQIEGISFECLTVEVKGVISCLTLNLNTILSATVTDISDGEERPILCAIPQLQYRNSPFLGVEFEQELPYQNSVLEQWTSQLAVPVDTLTFPRSGERTLKVNLRFVGTTAHAQVIFKYRIDDEGYLDRVDNRNKFEELALQIAFRVSAADGLVHKTEAKVIQNWIGKWVETEEDPEGRKETFRNILKSEFAGVEKRKNLSFNQLVGSLCGEILDVTQPADRYELMELCLAVAKADGVAEAEELEILDELAKLLEVDEERFRVMRDKQLTIDMVRDESCIDIDKILGISPDMDDKLVKTHLRHEFQKWNQLATHSDSAKRKQAEHMLDLIGKKRAAMK